MRDKVERKESDLVRIYLTDEQIKFMDSKAKFSSRTKVIQDLLDAAIRLESPRTEMTRLAAYVGTKVKKTGGTKIEQELLDILTQYNAAIKKKDAEHKVAQAAVA